MFGGTTTRDFEDLRREMVQEQIHDRGIHDRRVLDAMRSVPRHEFVCEQFVHGAYSDQPLPIGAGQTISQPFMVAAMTVAMELDGSERVLEIGTGSGYQAAVLSLLANEVHSVEFVAELAGEAEARLARLGYRNVQVHAGDGTLGWDADAPYGAVMVTAAAPQVPPPLIDQLADEGRLVIPVGAPTEQELLLVRKQGNRVTSKTLHYCRFVPLRGRYGWPISHS